MSDQQLYQLAAGAGISVDWNDYRGQPQRVGIDSLRRILTALDLPCTSDAQISESLARVDAERADPQLPPLITAIAGEPTLAPDSIGSRLRLRLEDGSKRDLVTVPADHGHAFIPAIAETGYHQLHLQDRDITIAVAPRRAFGVADIANDSGSAAPPRLWGLAAQLYSLRHTGDGGIGDFSALADLSRRAAASGAAAVAVSPVHALFAADLQRFGPYAPSSRLFVNALHVDPAAVFGAADMQAAIAATGVAAELARLEGLHLIDWPAAAAVRYRLLRHLFAQHRDELLAATPQTPLAREFAAFCTDGGTALEDHARFEALHAARFGADTTQWNWRSWPSALRDPRSAEVAAFAKTHADEIAFHRFLQWLADRGLADAQAAARTAGMPIGLIGDLAVGTDGGGSHSWSHQDDMLVGLSVGAPPDLLNGLGQNWGLTAFSPRGLRAHGYAPFIELLRANLRHAGGLRIDHVLGLGRLWLVPDGATANEGAYLQYPLRDLLRLIALESWRHRAVIVGEDLGTVPDGFRDQLDATGLMGMRVLWFERAFELFVEPARWSATAMATPTTHDLPTVAGWWLGRDIDWRVKLGQLPPESNEAAERELRERERRALWDAFRYAEVAGGERPSPEQSAAVIDAALRFVARTPAPLAIVPIEDIVGLDEQPNLPGTTDEHPNWRRRLPDTAEVLLAAPAAVSRLRSLREEREVK